MEIERKFLVDTSMIDFESYSYHELEQGYLCTNPVVRVRKEDNSYYLTYKGSGMMAHEEYNLPLTKESYEHLIQKADGHIISKRRYLIPYGKHTIELDVFGPPFAPLIMAEVEFSSIEEANSFALPEWFIQDVTNNKKYHNSNMSQRTL